MKFINVNGKILEADKAFIRTDNHSYRYGDGLFETMKMMDGRILLSDLHFERLFNSLSILKLEAARFLNRQGLEKEITDLCQKNNCDKLARIRLSISRGNGGLYDVDEKLQYVIECQVLDNGINELNETGLVIDVFPDARKTCDSFSNLKSASHLPYVMAARFAKENKLDDCLLLNMYDRICDSTIANLFWIKDKRIFTPPLSEGCIAGVMRRYLIERLQGTRYKAQGSSHKVQGTRDNVQNTSYKAQEMECAITEVENADEIFLTNAIQGIRWVKQFRDKIYTNTITKDIYANCNNL